MAHGCDHAAVPLVAGQHHQFMLLGDGLGGDGDVRLARQHVFAYLPRTTLVQRQTHVGIAGHKGPDHRRQRIAGLGVGRCDGEAAACLVAELGANLTQVVHVQQHPFGNQQHLPARRRDGH